MKKVVINRKPYGTFGLSQEALSLLAEKGMPFARVDKWGHVEEDDCYIAQWDDGEFGLLYPSDDTFRSLDSVIEVVETLGEKSWGEDSVLEVIEIEDDQHIVDDDGVEIVVNNVGIKIV